MKWFLKKKIKSEKSSDELDELNLLRTLLQSQAENIHLLEKESVYWKEKALNFRRFHQ